MRKLFLKIHKVLGFSVGIFFVISGLTGSALVFRPEIDAYFNKNLYIADQVSGEEQPFQKILDTVAEAHPENGPLYIKNVRPKNGTVQVWLKDGLKVYVNPYTLKIQGAAHSDHTLIGWIHSLHVELFMGEAGELIVGILGFISAFMVLTGLYLWWPGIQKIPERLKYYKGKNSVRWHMQNHKVTGALFSPLLLFSTVTGALIVFYPIIAGIVVMVTKADMGSLQSMSKIAPYEGRALAIDDLMEAGKQKTGIQNISWVYLSQNSESATIIRYRYENELHPNGNTYVIQHPKTADTIKIVKSADFPLIVQALNQVYPLHIGQVGLLLVRILVFLGGLIPAILFYTAYKYWKEKKKLKRSKVVETRV